MCLIYLPQVNWQVPSATEQTCTLVYTTPCLNGLTLYIIKTRRTTIQPQTLLQYVTTSIAYSQNIEKPLTFPKCIIQVLVL